MPCVAVTVDVAVALVDLGRYSLSKEMEIYAYLARLMMSAY